MSSHSRLSPSARHRWGVCPGSVRECAKYPERPSGPAAIDGTHSHTLLEWCLKNNLDPIVGMTFEDHEGSFTVDAERAERVKFACDYVRDHFNRIQADQGCTLLTEQKVNPSYLFNRDDLAGSVDVQLIGRDMIEIIDYKDGMDPVEAKGNLQMEMYGFGVLSPYVRDRNEVPFKTIRLTIIQPKLRLKGMTGIDSYVESVNDFMKKLETVRTQAAATDDPEAPLVPGDKQCKYCAHKGACAALTGQMMEKSGISFENLDIAKQAAGKEPTELSDEQLRELVEAAPLLRQLLEAAEAEAFRRLEGGKTIEGLKLVRGRSGHRSWLLSEEETAERLKKMGLAKNQIWETKLISPSVAEKAIAEKAAEKGQDPKKKIAMLNSEYVKKSEGKLTVATSSDSREAVIVDASPMFGVVHEIPSWLS